MENSLSKSKSAGMTTTKSDTDGEAALLMGRILQRWNSQILGRVFVCCMTHGEMVVLSQEQTEDERQRCYLDHFMVTICGRCELRQGLGATRERRFSINQSILESWDLYKTVRRWCGHEVEAIPRVVECNAIFRDWGYGVIIQGVRLIHDENGKQDLMLLPYVDVGFITGR